MFLKISQNSQENTYGSFSLQRYEKGDSGTGVLSQKFCEIHKNTFDTEHLRGIAPEKID